MYHIVLHKIKHHTRQVVAYCFIIIAMALGVNNTIQAQTSNMENGQTLYLDICTEGTTIYDDGGPDGNYSNSFSGWVEINTNIGDTIFLTGTYNIENSYDYITIYDNNIQIFQLTGSDTISLIATSGIMKINFYSDGSVTRPGFALTATTSASVRQCNATISNVTVTNINASSATLSWTSDASNLMLDYGVGPIAVADSSYTLTDLDANTPYTVSLYDQADSGERCCTYVTRFRTTILGSHGCIDPTDLTASYVLGFCGTFANPYQTMEIVDYGPSDINSRHTIHTNTNERDPRTGNQLYTVPPGGTSSVRLGNWRTGRQAEALLYAIEVDTLISDLLILKYAAVLEDPNHPAAEQPRFRMEILNYNMEVIDTVCGMADFIANANLGWNTYGSTLWKDWTTVGLDLSPYSGQTIFVRFTTYDCDQSGHYGYAYFTLECGRKNLTSESCGNNSDNTFTVPDGFSYLWYIDTVTNPISTSRSFNFSTDSNTIYHCRLSFIDKPACNFTMSAFAGRRFPLSLFDTTMIRTNCEFDVSFINRSTISADGVTPSGSGEGCETAWWNFGNGDTSSSYHASTHYDTPGTYIVTLVSTIANGLCTDTLQRTIQVQPPGPNPVIIGPTERCANDMTPDTLIILDAVWNSLSNDTLVVNPDTTTTYTVSATDSNSCAYTLLHTITVHPNYNRHDTAVICTPDLPYTYEDIVIASINDTATYIYNDTSIHGCDSIGTLFLMVNEPTTGDTLADACDSFSWHGVTYTSDGDTAVFITTNTAGCDSTVILRLTIRNSTYGTNTDTIVENLLPYHYHNHILTDSVSDTTLLIVNTAGCDSIVHYSLYVYWNVDTTLFDTLCTSSLPLTWNTIVFDTVATTTVNLVRTHIIFSHTGSDSIITMQLTVHPTFFQHHIEQICDDTVFHFGDNVYTLTGDYVDSSLSIHGCDSVQTLSLNVHPTYDHYILDSICSNQSISFFGQSYNTAGDHPHSFASQYGCDSTYTLHLTVWPAYNFHTYDTICDDSALFFIDSAYHIQGNYTYAYLTDHTCDSLQILHLTVHPSYDLHLYDTIYDGDHYTFEGIVYDTTGVYPHLLVSLSGCDSLRTLHLQRNRRTYNDSVVCQNSLPLVWNNVTFTDGQGIRSDRRQILADSVHLSGLDGIDSLVVMTVTALDTSDYHDILHGCDSLRWLNTVNYTASTSRPFITLTNHLGCDSVIHLNLTLDSTHRYTDVHHACDSMRWIDNRWYYADTVGPLDTLVTAHGCDSIVTLDLTTRYASYEESPADTFCYSQTYSWHNYNLHSTDTFATIDYHLIDTLHSIHGCDSVVAIHVTKMAKPHVHLDYDLNCKTRNYVLRVETDAPYFVWSSDPYDTLLDGADWQYDLLVSPQTPTEYLLYADYHQDPLCPVTTSLTLQPIKVPDALLRVAPDAFKYNSLEYSAHDMSMDYQERIWYLDGARQAETSRTISGTVDINTDSLVIALSVYNGQCYDTAVRVIPMLKVGVFAPNAFTPNLEQNNRFTLVTHGIISGELFIYNREGLLVYQTTDFENRGWNGGTEPQGNYVWRLDYYAIDYPEIRQSTVGTILLIR